MASLDDLLQQRLAQLKSIADRRNDLLREMFLLMRRRDSVGNVLALADQHEEQNLHLFLQRFDLSKYPESGSIANLSENELFAPETNPEISLTPSNKTIVALSGTQSISSSAEKNTVQGHLLIEPEKSPLRSDVVSSHFHPRHIPEDESDDELDMFGPYHREPTPQHSNESIHLPAATSPDVMVVTDDDLADGEGDIDIEEGLDDEPFDLLNGHVEQSVSDQNVEEEHVVEATEDEKMALDQCELTDRRESPQRTVNDLGPTHAVDVPREMTPVPPKEIIDRMDLQPDVVLKAYEERATVFSELSLLTRYSPSPYPLSDKTSRPIFITGSVAPLKAYKYAFDSEIDNGSYAEKTGSPTASTPLRSGLHTNYSLPPLKSLPAEYNRKNKSKQRKREKDKDRNDVKKDTNGDWTPVGLNKWTATINANPVWKKVSRATKCLNSREWTVAMTELRLMRAVGRIESLKSAGGWSFRQPKKQRGVGGLVKTHWDYLLDEMKWMRIDFREERKWKMALAFNLSTSVLEWHAAGSWNERFAQGIAVRWKRPLPMDRMESDGNLVEELTQSAEYQLHQPHKASLLGLDYGSDDDDDDEQDREVIDALRPSTLLEETLGTPTGGVDAENTSTVTQLKTEEVEDLSVLGEPSAPVPDSQDTPQSDAASANNESNVTIGLKSTSNDPMWSSNRTSQLGDRDPSFVSSPNKLESKTSVYAPIRELVAYTDEQKLFLSLQDLHLDEPTAVRSNELSPSADLPTIFPDLQPFDILDIAPAVASVNPEGRKKSERRGDKDDPNKRIEDTTYSKLFPASRFMRTKPTLLGPLLPSKRWRGGSWTPIEEVPIVPEVDGSTKVTDEHLSELFEYRANSAAAAFWQATAMKERDPRRKPSEHNWTPNDDALLKSCIDKYPYNWYLIAECFNASRVTISTDKRSARDCLERWREKWGPEFRVRQAETNAVSTEATSSPSASQNQMTTRGVKRLASASVASPTSGFTVSGTEPRKRRRHMLMQDTIRKYAKKRIESLQKANAQRKPSIIHETHGQYAKLPKLSPAELIRLKAERDAREHQEMVARKRHVEELGRQVIQARLSQQNSQLLQQQQPQVQAQPQAQPQPQPQPQQQSPHQQQATAQQQSLPTSNSTPRPASIGIPASQGVPQIRTQVNISQQQRIAAALATANARLSPQQQQLQGRVVGQAGQQAQILAQSFSQGSTVSASNQGGNSNGATPQRDSTSSPAHVSPGLGSPRGYYVAGMTAEQLSRLQMLVSDMEGRVNGN